MNQEVCIKLPMWTGFDLAGPLWAFLAVAFIVGFGIGLIF